MREITNEYTEKEKVSEGCFLNYCHKPDPICKNEGKCSTQKNGNVTCDCRWTGFTGVHCTERKLCDIQICRLGWISSLDPLHAPLHAK